LYELKLEKIEYRASGSGASDLDLVQADLKGADHTTKTNFISGTALPVSKEPIISNGTLNGDVKITNVGTGAERAFYEIDGSFTINKSDFLKEDNYKLRFFRESTTPGTFTKFDLTLYQDAIIQAPYYEITPIDVDGTVYTGNKVKKFFDLADLGSTGDYEIVVPETDELIAGPNIASYQIYFYEYWQENYGTNPSEGPIDLETNPENYFFTVFALEEFSPIGSGDRIVAGATNLTNFSFTGLTSGIYDFKVTFALRSYDYNSQTATLEQASYQVFSNYAYEQRVLVEDFDDLPGLEDVPVEPKAVWSCNRVIEHFGKLMVWGSQEMPNSVFYSFPDRPTYFPQNFYLNFGNDSEVPVEAVTPYMNVLVVQTADQTWGVRGNSGLITAPSPYTSFTINSTVGAIAWKSVRPVRNHLFFLSKQGVIALKSLYAADEQYNIEFMDRNIRNIVPQDTNAVGIQFDNQYWLNFPESGITLRWYIDKKAWVLDKYTAWFDFNGVHKWQIINGMLEFITYPSVFEDNEALPDNVAFYKIGIDYSLPTDLGKNVVSKIETSFLNQNYPFHPKNYKEAKLDFTVQNEYNLSKDALAIYPWTSEDTEKAITVEGTDVTISSVSVDKNHRYRLTFDAYTPDGETPTPWDFTDGTIDIDGDSSSVTIEETGEGYVQFLLPNDIDGSVTITFSFPNITIDTENDEIDFRDVTYDNELSFAVQVVSENNILNQDLYQGYDDPKIGIDINFKDRLGDWTFGLTDFGKKVTAVDTIKLSGRGYNSKIYFEDTSKSKWTLESIGITFKMKRARSR
jgi:hypothetical protein